MAFLRAWRTVRERDRTRHARACERTSPVGRGRTAFYLYMMIDVLPLDWIHGLTSQHGRPGRQVDSDILSHTPSVTNRRCRNEGCRFFELLPAVVSVDCTHNAIRRGASAFIVVVVVGMPQVFEFHRVEFERVISASYNFCRSPKTTQQCNNDLAEIQIDAVNRKTSVRAPNNYIVIRRRNNSSRRTQKHQARSRGSDGARWGACWTRAGVA